MELKMRSIFDINLDTILNEEIEKIEKFKAAVGVVQWRKKWLLGLAKNTSDDREGKWVFPGGGIKGNESPEKAVIREVREETGIRCKVVKQLYVPSKKDVAFFHCKVNSRQEPKPNSEFSILGWFDDSELYGLKLYHNVRYLLEKIKR